MFCFARIVLDSLDQARSCPAVSNAFACYIAALLHLNLHDRETNTVSLHRLLASHILGIVCGPISSGSSAGMHCRRRCGCRAWICRASCTGWPLLRQCYELVCLDKADAERLHRLRKLLLVLFWLDIDCASTGMASRQSIHDVCVFGVEIIRLSVWL